MYHDLVQIIYHIEVPIRCSDTASKIVYILEVIGLQKLNLNVLILKRNNMVPMVV
uniref:Uncharacterized protein n=1 Tax=viral metagenome TaxID=1070528 RepID=A0A6C0BNS4_9ZZZZ